MYKKQTHLEFKINNYKSSHIFLVIPNLSCKIILGNDWHLKNKSIINYSNKTIQLENFEIPSELTMFRRGRSDRLLCSQDVEMTLVYLININKMMTDVNMESSEGEEKNKEGKSIDQGMNEMKCKKINDEILRQYKNGKESLFEQLCLASIGIVEFNTKTKVLDAYI